MQTDPDRKGFVPWMALAVFVLLGYPLSVVPVDWLSNHGYADFPAWIADFYAPLRWVLEIVEPNQSFRDWYVDVVS